MSEQINMTQVVLENMRDNGGSAQFNRDLAIGYVSGDLQDKETLMRKELLPEIKSANAAFAADEITSEQRDLIVQSATDQLARQAALNERIMNKRR